MDFNSRVVPVFMLWLPKISGSSIVNYEISQFKVKILYIELAEMIGRSYWPAHMSITNARVS